MTIDALEAALEARLNRESAAKLYAADCCVICKLGIASSYQLKNPGTDVCELCAGEEEIAIPVWDSTTYYTYPTEVMFNGQRCFAVGVGNVPVTPESMCAEKPCSE